MTRKVKTEIVEEKQPKFKVDTVQYVSVRIIEGSGQYNSASGKFFDAVHPFTREEAFDLAEAVEEAARKL